MKIIWLLYRVDLYRQGNPCLKLIDRPDLPPIEPYLDRFELPRLTITPGLHLPLPQNRTTPFKLICRLIKRRITGPMNIFGKHMGLGHPLNTSVKEMLHPPWRYLRHLVGQRVHTKSPTYLRHGGLAQLRPPLTTAVLHLIGVKPTKTHQ